MNSFFLTAVISLALIPILIAGLFLIFRFVGVTVFVIALLISIAVFVGTMVIVFLFQRAALKKTKYIFYSDKVEFFDGFLVKNRKTINYDRISNIGQRKGIIEGWFGLGTIYIDTAGFSPRGHELMMRYLENPDRVYDKISKLTSKKY